jgi:hypothetical protein
MRFLTGVLAVVACVNVAAGQRAPDVNAARKADAASCRPVGPPRLLPNVPEASGIAIGSGSRTAWTHNDSGRPVVFRVDGEGQPTPVLISGADVRDWEDVAIGKCPAGTCLYIADIGDNRGSRPHISIYRVPEPGGSTGSGTVEVFHARYPDRPHDAEALVVTPRDELFIVTKEVPAQLYRVPTPLKAGSTATLQLVRSLGERLRITGAAASPDGRWIALRSNGTLLLYRSAELAKGGEPIRIDLSSLKEPQGEGVAFGDGGEIYLVSEGRGRGAAGVLTRLNCTLPN